MRIYIRNLKINSIVETECPTIQIAPLLQKEVCSFVYKSGFIDDLTTKKITINTRFTIIYTIIAIASIPILTVIGIFILMSIIIPNDFTFINPIHIVKLLTFLTIVFSIIPFVWLIYNNQLNNCIYLNILTKIIQSYHRDIKGTTSREELFMYYLKSASKEWDYYYDHISKL